jgi:serine/threonine-protein kinase
VTTGAVVAVPFDLDRTEVTGAAVPVLSQVVTTSTGALNFDIGRDGTLVYVPSTEARADSHQRALVWVDRQGREEAIGAPPREYSYPRISPDGKRVALDIRDQENDIWIWDFDGRTLTRATFDPGLDRNPVWTPDGQRFIFSSTRSGGLNLHWQAADNSGSAEQLTHGPNNQVASSVSPDGDVAVFGEAGAGLMALALRDGFRVSRLIDVQTRDTTPNGGEISPDGRWLAYHSNESGQQSQVYVRPFPNVNAGRWQLSTDGGAGPLWAPSSQELFYVTPTGNVMVVAVQASHSPRISAPVRLFEGRYFFGGASGRTFDVSPDGKRFLMITAAGTDSVAINAMGQTRLTEEGFVVVQHWFELLNRLVH